MSVILKSIHKYPLKSKALYVCTLTFLLFALSLVSQDSSKRLPAKLAFSTGKANQDFNLGKTAPRVWADVERVQFPDPNQFRLTFPSNKAGFFSAPDSGEVYLWSKGLYRWTRKDGSTYSEWESGQWQLSLADGTTLNYYHEKNTPGKFYLVYSDKTSLQKNWISHRGDFEFIYQKSAGLNSESFTIPNPSKFGKNRSEWGRLDFFFPESWRFYIEAFQRDISNSNFYSYLKTEYNLDAQGEVPLLFFEKRDEISKYVGRTLINNSQEGGFGGRDSVMLCCGDSKPQKTGNATLDNDQEKRMFFGTFYHELVHNVAQLHCFKTNAGKEPLPPEKVEDWFVEGFANLVSAEFEPNKKAFLWESTKTLFDEKKVPASYESMVQAKYNNMLPYSLGAYFGSYLQDNYGKQVLTDYLTKTCGGELGKDVLRASTGKSAEVLFQEAIKEFPKRYSSIEPNLRKWKSEGYTIIVPENQALFESALPSLNPPVEGEDLPYEKIPDFYNSLLAKVEDFKGKVEGEFATQTTLGFYLWKKGNYRWYNEDFEADFFPGDQVFIRFNKGGAITVWADGRKRLAYPNGTSVFYWNSMDKGFFDKNGKQIP